jgi:ABC-2 type transport system ATP-binding protein
MIETHDLSKTYERPSGWRRATRPQPTTAVQPITLSVQPGELFGLLGPNGAGKTTLVKMLCTLISPSSGTAVVGGHPLSESGKIRATIGLVVSDERSFYWRLSARQNLAFFAAMYGLHGHTASQRIDQVLHHVALHHAAERRFSDFSSGMRQRLAIARALLHQPTILFLDEPSRSLDPTATAQLHTLIQQLQAEQQMTIFLITHDLLEAEKLCSRVALMHQGRIQTIGSPHILREQLRPQRTYHILLDTAVPTPLIAQLPYLTIPEPHTLTFTAAEHDGRLTAVLHHLQQAQLPIRHIESSLPTLEDVFAHYTQTPTP